MAIVAAVLEMPISAKQMLENSKEIKHDEEPTISEEKKIESNDAGVIWLLPNEKLLKQFKWLKYLFIVIIIFMFYSISTQFIELDNIGRFILLLPLGGLFFIYNNLNYAHHAIGIDDKYLYIQTSKTKKASASFSEVLYSTENTLLDDSSPTRIAIDTITLPLFHSNEKGIYSENSLFDKEQFDYYISPKLLKAKKISWQSMLEKQIKDIDYKEWALIAFFIFLMSIVYSLTTISK